MMGNMAWLLLNADGENFVQGLLNVISLIATAIGVLMTFYAIFLMYLFATASDENKRRAAKKRIFTIGSSVLIIIALVFSLVAIKDTININRVSGGNGSGDSYTGGSALASAGKDAFVASVSIKAFSSAPPSRMKAYGDCFTGADTHITGTATFTPNTGGKEYFKVSGGEVTAVTSVEIVAATGILSGGFWTKDPGSTGTNFVLIYDVYANTEQDMALGPGSGRRYITFQGNDMSNSEVRLAIKVTCTCKMKIGEGRTATETEVTGITINTWLVIKNPPSSHEGIPRMTVEYQNASGAPAGSPFLVGGN